MVLFAVRFSFSIITEYHFLVNLTVLNFTESLDILNYVKNGGTVVMSTHDRDEIDLCTKLYKIEDGILKECEG